MRIVFDYQIFATQRYGGISRYFVELTKHLIEYADPKIIAPTFINEYISELPENLKVGHKINLFNARGTTKLSKAINFLTATSLESAHNPDIIHQTYYNRSFQKNRRKFKTAITVYDMIHEIFDGQEGYQVRSNFLNAKANAIKNSDIIFCISENTKRDLMERIQIPERKIIVTHLAHSAFFAQPLHLARKNQILYVGSRSWYKNFGRFLEAIKLSELHLTYDIVCFGGGMFTSKERELILKLGLEGRITQLEGGDAVLKNLYCESKLFVFPSLYEGFGIPILEAMASGCPVACSNTSCFPEIGGDAAVYFNPLDSLEIASAMSSLLKDQARIQIAIEQGKEQSSKFSWTTCAQTTVSGYSSLLSINS